MSTIHFTVNGQSRRWDGDGDRTLLSWLREERGLVATKDGCSGQAFCWSCAVDVDGRARLACATPLRRLEGAEVTTLEGMPDPVRRILGEAFVRRGAVQCGFCTPGYLIEARALLERNPDPSRSEVVSALRRHLCRCTGYHSIVDAVLEAARAWREDAHAPTAPPRGVGRDQPKVDAFEKAVGRSPFVDDLRPQGLLHGAVRLSDHVRARVETLDVERARSMQGVVAVLTADDVPGQRRHGLIVADWPLMIAVGETTRYDGDVLAVVVAEDEATARAAAAAIRVDYEVLAPLTDPERALDSSVLVHEGGNLIEETRIQRGGDVDEHLAASAHVARGTFHTQRIEHAFLEPEACVAVPEGDGVLVHSQGQGVYEDRRQIAALLDLPLESVRVRQWAAGGAFGGKEDLSIQGHAALAATRLRRPVKVKLDRAESIRMHPKRHPMRLDFALGCDASGRLTALRARILGDSGAYASVGGKVLERAAGHSTGAYHVPCVDVVAQAVYTNGPPCGAMRGFGANQANFALESCVDELCRRGGFDRWQMRWDNALTAGSLTATGQRLGEGVGVRATLEAVKDEYDRSRHRGLACGIKNCGIGNGMTDGCEVKVEVLAADHVRLHHGWTEMGQGVHTVARQVLTEETGIDPEIVEVVVSTEHGAEAGMTTASRGTSLVGNALLDACRRLKEDLRRSQLADLVGRSYRGHWAFEDSTAPGQPGEVVTHYSYGYATQLVVLDEEGAIERVVAAHDAGRVINPALFRGQIHGAVHMGLGYALSEELPLENGSPATTRLSRLGLIPMHEMPEVIVIPVEVPDPLGPYGAKGVGEIGLVPTAAAVANALSDFDGVWRDRLPLRPPRGGRR